MTEYHDHRDDCPFKFATLDVCDCVEKNMLDRIKALTKEREQWRRAAETRAEGWKISDDARIEAEAKLAKAVEAAEEMSAAFYSGGNVTERHLRACNAGVKLHATLAEIKGESR